MNRLIWVSIIGLLLTSVGMAQASNCTAQWTINDSRATYTRLYTGPAADQLTQVTEVPVPTNQIDCSVLSLVDGMYVAVDSRDDSGNSSPLSEIIQVTFLNSPTNLRVQITFTVN